MSQPNISDTIEKRLDDVGALSAVIVNAQRTNAMNETEHRRIIILEADPVERNRIFERLRALLLEDQ